VGPWGVGKRTIFSRAFFGFFFFFFFFFFVFQLSLSEGVFISLFRSHTLSINKTLGNPIKTTPFSKRKER